MTFVPSIRIILCKIINRYNDMSLKKLNKSVVEDCSQHKFCPHQHFKKCQKYRQRILPYTYRPIKQIEVECNVHPKLIRRLGIGNVPTIAYERYQQDPILPDQEQMNFSKNYYLENCPQNFKLCNTLIQDVQNDLSQGNAYALASGATEQYNRFATQREQYLATARRRADAAFNQFYFNKKMEKEKNKAEQAQWVTSYFRKVQELIEHIFKTKQNQNDDPNVKQKMFMRQHEGQTAKTLKGMKLSNPEAALKILESLRAVLLKRKMDLEEERKDQEHNKSVSASYMDSSNTSQSNLSGVSFMSATTVGTKQDKQADFAEQFCDFQALQKKWGRNNVEEVRNTLRRMLCRNLLNKAEGQHMKEKRRAKEKDQFLRKQMEKLGKFKGKTKEVTQTKGKKGGKSMKQTKASLTTPKEDEKPVLNFKDPLSKEEQGIKRTLLKGGIYDTMGDKYQRNRNYSSLFTKRRDQSLCELSFRESPQKEVQTARPMFR